MPIPLVFQGKFTENYFKKLHLPKIQFQLLGGRFLDLLPYIISSGVKISKYLFKVDFVWMFTYFGRFKNSLA